MSNNLTLPNAFEIHGNSVPAVGLGTFQGGATDGDVKQVVLRALQQGYRHIDTATAYGNEKAVGDALRESGIPRDEVFITTKLYGSPTLTKLSTALISP